MNYCQHACWGCNMILQIECLLYCQNNCRGCRGGESHPRASSAAVKNRQWLATSLAIQGVQTLPGHSRGRGRCGRCRNHLIDQRCASGPFQYVRVRSVHIHYLKATIYSLTYYVVVCIGTADTSSLCNTVSALINDLTGHSNYHCVYKHTNRTSQMKR